jgi:hypothetical protein
MSDMPNRLLEICLSLPNGVVQETHDAGLDNIINEGMGQCLPHHQGY